MRNGDWVGGKSGQVHGSNPSGRSVAPARISENRGPRLRRPRGCQMIVIAALLAFGAACGEDESDLPDWESGARAESGEDSNGSSDPGPIPGSDSPDFQRYVALCSDLAALPCASAVVREYDCASRLGLARIEAEDDDCGDESASLLECVERTPYACADSQLVFPSECDSSLTNLIACGGTMWGEDCNLGIDADGVCSAECTTFHGECHASGDDAGWICTCTTGPHEGLGFMPEDECFDLQPAFEAHCS